MRRGDRQSAFFFLVIGICQAADIFDLAHDDPSSVDHFFPGPCHPLQAFSFARKKLQAELFFKQLQLFADTRLRRIQAFGCSRNVQSIVGYSQQIFELL